MLPYTGREVDELLEFLGLSDDDPPIFALRVRGGEESPGPLLASWLERKPDVQRVDVSVGADVHLSEDEITELSRRYDVTIEVHDEGSAESGTATTT